MPPSSPVSSPSSDGPTVARRKRARVEEDEGADGAEPKRRQADGATTRARSAEPEPARKLETSPSDVAELEELRRPRATRARGSVLPSLAGHEEECHRPVTRASSKKSKEEAEKQHQKEKKETEADGARGILRSTRRRGRTAAPVNRELFRLPTLADLTRVTRSSSRRKPPRPVPAAHPVGVSGSWDSGEETEREDEVPDASTPEPAVVVREVRVEAVVDAVFECSEACLCGGKDDQDESCDDRRRSSKGTSSSSSKRQLRPRTPKTPS